MCITTTANNKEIERIVNTVAAVRQAIGPQMAMMVEMHTRFDLPTAIRLVKAFEPFNPTWIEEPVPPENMDALREVTQSSNTPICVGENLYMVHQFENLLEKKAADIIMPDVQKCGGIGEAQRIANMAYAHYVPFAPHMVGLTFCDDGIGARLRFHPQLFYARIESKDRIRLGRNCC